MTGMVTRATDRQVHTTMGVRSNVNEITTESWALIGKLDHEWSLGETQVRVGYASFDDLQDEFEYEVDFDRSAPRFTGDLLNQAIKDTELFVNLEHEFELNDNLEFAIGGFVQNKDRDTDLQTVRSRFNLTAANRQGYDQFTRNPAEFAPATFPPLEPTTTRIEEDRRDLYALVEGEFDNLTFEVGIRWENTDVTVTDFLPGGADAIEVAYARRELGRVQLKLDRVDEAERGIVSTASLVSADRRRLLASPKAGPASYRLFEMLPMMPRFSIERVRQQLDTTFPTATAAVKVLEDLGIVVEMTGQKKNRSLIKNLSLSKAEVTMI